MTVWRNVYARGGEVFLGSLHASYGDAERASQQELSDEPRTYFVGVAQDMSEEAPTIERVENLARDYSRLVKSIKDREEGAGRLRDNLVAALRDVLIAYRNTSAVFHEGDSLVFECDPAVLRAESALALARACGAAP